MTRRITSSIIVLLSLVSLVYLAYENRMPLEASIHQLKRDISDNYLLANKLASKDSNQPPAQKMPPKIPELDPCTVINPASNGFFDLRELSSLHFEDGTNPSWNARGWDYGMNFTLGICSTPLKKNHINGNDFQDVSNVSLVGGYYTDKESIKHSIGEFSTKPVFRGRKLTLTYENGDYCRETIDGEKLRKSTILSFSCDRAIMSKAQVSFVGVLHDCDYFFEVKTVHACPTAAKEDNLALVWIFALILLAALFVFCGAGTLYRRFGRRTWKPISSSHGLMHQIKSIVSGPVSNGY